MRRSRLESLLKIVLTYALAHCLDLIKYNEDIFSICSTHEQSEQIVYRNVLVSHKCMLRAPS